MADKIINPFTHIQDPPEQRFYDTTIPTSTEVPKTEVELKGGINLDFFKGNVTVTDPVVGEDADVTPARKRGRPRKSESEKMIKANAKETEQALAGEISFANSNVPYAKSFEKTTAMLESSVYQIDNLSNEVHAELETVRNSKTLKGRYTYISDLTSTASSLLTTKISAIREMNSVIQQAHKLDLDRIKAFKLNEAAQNDDAQIQAMYNAYINTPISTGYNPLAFDTQSVLMGGSEAANIVRADASAGPSADAGYNNFVSNITPEQNRMLLENDPNIKTVVVYDQSNPSNRYFDVIDSRTGQSVPNYPRPDPIFLEETTINPMTGLARNSNIDATWPVVVIGQNPDLESF
ncbi:MAG: hypothetical protein J6Y02_10215 [Pseudobutyrivibrio sp.]|nr:hypothetical protein [Pseudobutyrivibrio sp.]